MRIQRQVKSSTTSAAAAPIASAPAAAIGHGTPCRTITQVNMPPVGWLQVHPSGMCASSAAESAAQWEA